MNQEILKRLDGAISSNLLGVSKDPDCIVGASVCVILTSRKICQLITPQLRYLYLLQTCFCIQNEAHRIAVSSVQ